MSTVNPRLLDILGGWIKSSSKPVPLIGVAGPQGSGKTTICRAAAERFGAAYFSIDDIYLTKTAREKLAREAHPLFAVRGPPGTHDLGLGQSTVAALSRADQNSHTPIPAFDKLADDRKPATDWPVFAGRPAAILIDGWCMGATPLGDVELNRPINKLEAEEDPEAVWRRYWNAALRGRYKEWFGTFDKILFLAAPSFDVVLDWRCEQEAGLMKIAPRDLPLERRAKITRFIAHYEHLTVHMLKGGVRADVTARLDASRTILAVE